jgi:hypothetical protein
MLILLFIWLLLYNANIECFNLNIFNFIEKLLEYS